MIPAWLVTVAVGAVGTAVAAYLQDRSWRHQHEVVKREESVAAATGTFEGLSTAMDQRIFTMRQVYSFIGSDHYSEKDVEEKWQQYRKILFEWNGTLNKKLSMIERYFGRKASKLFEFELQRDFRELGQMLESYYYEADARKDFDHQAFEQLADRINETIRRFNLKMIGHIQRRDLGVFNPDVPESEDEGS